MYHASNRAILVERTNNVATVVYTQATDCDERYKLRTVLRGMATIVNRAQFTQLRFVNFVNSADLSLGGDLLLYSCNPQYIISFCYTPFRRIPSLKKTVPPKRCLFLCVALSSILTSLPPEFIKSLIWGVAAFYLQGYLLFSFGYMLPKQQESCFWGEYSSLIFSPIFMN